MEAKNVPKFFEKWHVCFRSLFGTRHLLQRKLDLETMATVWILAAVFDILHSSTRLCCHTCCFLVKKKVGKSSDCENVTGCCLKLCLCRKNYCFACPTTCKLACVQNYRLNFAASCNPRKFLAGSGILDQHRIPENRQIHNRYVVWKFSSSCFPWKLIRHKCFIL